VAVHIVHRFAFLPSMHHDLLCNNHLMEANSFLQIKGSAESRAYIESDFLQIPVAKQSISLKRFP